MEKQIEMVSLDQLLDGYSMVSISDVYETLQKNLGASELQKYSIACLNVMRGLKLSRSEAILLNKIDEITTRTHGMCLKDSKVTKARLKACRRFGIKLIDHMNLFLS